jgi:DNA-binding response OmpR family regulator
MSGPNVNLPPSHREERTVTVLAVSPNPDTVARLRGIFEHTNWGMDVVKDCESALDFARRQPVAVVICERYLPDGTWRDLYQRVSVLAVPPPVIVTSHDADDELWSEVLDSGGYDVLARPLMAAEVTRIVSLAWLHWKTLRQGRKAAAARASAGGGDAPKYMAASA